MKKFWVYFTNHGYYSEQKFERLSDAIAYGKGLHFEFAVHYRKPDGTFELVASWGPIRGLKHYAGATRD
jgi:hypothetical protein